jgi:hypothetical protein
MTVREHDNLELLSMRRISDSLEATRTMLRQAQKITQEAQAALINLATELCSQELKHQQEWNEDLYQVLLEELAALLHSRYKTLKLASSKNETAQLAEANRIINELRAEVETQRNRADLTNHKAGQLEKQVQILERTLETEYQKRGKAQDSPATYSEMVPPSEDSADFQTWYATWQVKNRNWERDRQVLLVAGKTGLSLSPELETMIARKNEISTRTAHRAILECVKVGLLDQALTASFEGRPPMRYTLTDKGRWLYLELTGEEPMAPKHQELLKAHKSERHLVLIVKAAEHFYRLGYDVEREPLRQQVGENRFFQPDLVVKKDSDTYYLEVDTGEKDKTKLNQKWENALTAGGRICVVTDNISTLRRVQGGIAQWSVFEGRRLTLYITCLVTLKERKAGDLPWYAVKEYAPD